MHIYTHTHTYIYIYNIIYFTNIELLGGFFIVLWGKHYFLFSLTTLKCLILYYKLSCTKLEFFMGVKHLFQCVLVGMRIIVLCKECSGGDRPVVDVKGAA